MRFDSFIVAPPAVKIDSFLVGFFFFSCYLVEDVPRDVPREYRKKMVRGTIKESKVGLLSVLNIITST